jgi:hypothetical protein
MKEILPHGHVYTRIQDSGYKTGMPVHVFSYRNKGALQDIWDVVMVGGKKTINPEWMDRITPAAIAYWFMDDGSSCFRKNSVVVRFSTYSFSKHEISLLRTKLNDFEFKTYVQQSKHGPVISLSQKDTSRFMNLVQPTISMINCMKYKIKYPNLPQCTGSHPLHV